MPRVQQTCRPIPETSRTVASTESNCAPSRTSRQAAPMQKREAPPARAARAAEVIDASSISASASRPVS